MQIYTADTALQSEDRTLLSSQAPVPRREPSNIPTNESSLAHFCAFVDFYTRKTADPMSTALACEKHAEALEIAPQDATPENMRLLVDTLLEVIDHLEKKWLDEQIRHEERMQKHREDVARLSQQIRELHAHNAQRSGVYQKGMQWLQQLMFRTPQAPTHHIPKRAARRRSKSLAKHRMPAVKIANAPL